MKSTKRATVVILILTMLTIGISPADAQDVRPIPGAWTLAETMQPGEDLEIRLANGDTVRGKFSALTSNMVVVRRGNTTIETERTRIRSIHTIGSRNVGKSVLVGLGIGAGAGAAIGGIVAAANRPAESGEEFAPVFQLAAVGAIIGTAAGLIRGFRRKKKVLIYESI